MNKKNNKNKEKNIQKISKEMNIMKIVQEHPESADIMFKHGLHCLGCIASSFESLEEGCKAHGMTEKDIQNLVDEINKAIPHKREENNKK